MTSAASPTPPPPSGEGPKGLDRTLLVILSIIGVLVLIALIIVFSRDEPQSLDATTPEGVVQRYATAVIAGDEAAASAYLTARSTNTCDGYEQPVTDDIRVTLSSTTVRDDTADVRVTIVTSFGAGLFGPSEYSVDEVFDLVKADEGWLIDRAPWQLTICTDPGATR